MNERQNAILELIVKNGKMEVATLSQLLNVSQVTIRKDLDVLVKSGILIREHGYAKLNDSQDLNHRLAYHYDLKKRIARMACKDIKDKSTIMIESGSCCALFAYEIAKTKKHVTMITNSCFIADYIREFSNIDIILLGGFYQKEAQVNVGPMLKKCVSDFFVDQLFIGMDGFSIENGFTGNDYMRCVAVKDMAQQAKHVCIISESHKFNRTSTSSLIDVKDAYAIYTDDKLDDDICTYLEEQHVKVKKSS